MADNEKDNYDYNFNENDDLNEDDAPGEDDRPDGNSSTNDEDNWYETIDVSEPRAPIREIDVIEEALAIRRRDWIKTHLSYIFAGVGIIVVVLIVFLINMFFQNSNPMRRFTASLSNNFRSSFQFEVQITEDDQPVMSYDGAVDVNLAKHTIRSVYEADYNRYQFSGAVYADKDRAKKGTYYDKKWLVRECLDNAQDFFDFDRDFRSNSFDGGAFLRFTGLTSEFSTRELNKFVNTLMKRMSTDSAVATITTEKADGETRYHYDISLQAIFEMVKSDGASIFYRASDYDTFCSDFEMNKGIIENAKCTVDFAEDGAGHMSFLEAKTIVEGKAYGMTCHMSGFGSTQVEVPAEFLKAAEIPQEE